MHLCHKMSQEKKLKIRIFHRVILTKQKTPLVHLLTWKIESLIAVSQLTLRDHFHYKLT